ncbi:hypothetical protein [Edaphobacter modestus]|uniref:Uncharacterized protein n=1 Tax=Edaphobacter modestus TaxID=388466 RepID=A0A4Q7YVX7_9BACT|nr:hypothetical protein [Edaphobacter modestus]RZU41179.1 hypothetical protein BDD14_2681 [Edaphobacter modestus]
MITELTDTIHIPEQPTPASRRCRHLGSEDRRCGSPAMRGERFCYHHHETSPPVANLRQRRARQASFSIPVPNSRAEIQHAIGDIMLRIANNDIDLRRAGLLLYALQTANSNLTEHQRQNAQPKPSQAEPTQETKCHPERSEAKSKDLRSAQDTEPTEPNPPYTYGSGPTPDLPRPGAETPTPSTPADFTPPPPQWRRLSRPTAAALLEALGRHYGAEPLPGSPEDRGDLNLPVSNDPDTVESSAPPLGLKQDQHEGNAPSPENREASHDQQESIRTWFQAEGQE